MTRLHRARGGARRTRPPLLGREALGVSVCLLAATLVAAGCCGGGRRSDPERESQPGAGQGAAQVPTQPSTPTQSTPGDDRSTVMAAQDQRLGQEVVVGDFRVTVHGSSSKTSTQRGLATYQAGTGAALRIVEFTVTNGFSRPMVLATRVWLKDASERQFQPTPACQFATPEAIGRLDQINPGLSRRGRMCFEIPSDASGLKLVFRDGLKTASFPLE